MLGPVNRGMLYTRPARDNHVNHIKHNNLTSSHFAPNGIRCDQVTKQDCKERLFLSLKTMIEFHLRFDRDQPRSSIRILIGQIRNKDSPKTAPRRKGVVAMSQNTCELNRSMQHMH